jgi:predicted transcriptional regulator
MEERTLTITLNPDWRAALRAAGARAKADTYQGETLNFESVGALFARLTERRWTLVRALMGAGELSVRELARHLGRDVKLVHEEVASLAQLGLVERTERGGVLCPYIHIHVDLQLSAEPRQVA